MGIYRGPHIEWRIDMTDEEHNNWIDQCVLEGSPGDFWGAAFILACPFLTFALGYLVGRF